MPRYPAPRYNCKGGSQHLIRALDRGYIDSRRREVTSKMVKVSIEVRSGAARFDEVVWAESIERATNLLKGSYPASEVRAPRRWWPCVPSIKI
jgi:hypothetical protein